MHTSSKKLRDYEELIRSFGCIITGADNDIQIHHVKGRKYKHNKQLIGPYYVFPLHESLHLRDAEHPKAFHKGKHAFYEEFGSRQYLWTKVYLQLMNHNPEIYGFTNSIQDSIMDCPI